MRSETEEMREAERQKVMDLLELKWLRAEHALTAALARIDELVKKI